MTAAERRKRCDSLILGSLLRGYMELGIYPWPKTPSAATISLRELADGLQKIKIFYYPHFPPSDGDCNKTVDIKAKLIEQSESALKIAITQVMEKYAVHLKTQAEKCQTLAGFPSTATDV